MIILGEQREKQLQKAGDVIPAVDKSLLVSNSRARGVLLPDGAGSTLQVGAGPGASDAPPLPLSGGTTGPLFSPSHCCPGALWATALLASAVPAACCQMHHQHLARWNTAKGWEVIPRQPAPRQWMFRQLCLLTYGKGWLLSLVSSQTRCKVQLKAFNGPLMLSLQIQRDREHSKLSKYDLTV